MMICEVKAFGRIHAGLIDLSGAGYRMNGGVGWAIDGVAVVVRARTAKAVRVTDRRATPLGVAERDALAALATALSRAKGQTGADIEITGDLVPHIGLGAGTATRLAVLESCARIWGLTLPRAELVAFSGRGGTSGVGIRTYFEGGLVLDLGHRRDGPAAPSRDRAAAGPAMSLVRVAMPRWCFGLTRPTDAQRVDIAAERAVFDRVLPLSEPEAHAALYHALYGVIGGARDDDPATFAAAIDALQLGAWKRAEWSLHGAPLVALGDGLRGRGARGVGLTSMGPTLFFLGEADPAIDPAQGAVRWVRPRNRGRTLMLHDDG